ncbi:PRC and DUF2382 domain-containing protein [Nocardioides sp. KR10-350]|uniref:PRC and DUF2382 domain-containing protein n=1 Tax=Nocardioides cheoyonin TaxID=3156615 RepID=UPI0032B57451
MLNETELHDVLGSTAYGADGSKVGKVGQVFVDDETGRPEFATVNTGLFGTSESFVPLADATFDGERLIVPFSKEQVKEAPSVELDGEHLDQAEERRLYDYYRMPYSEALSDSGLPDSGRTETAAPDAGLPTGTAGTDTSRSAGDDVTGPTTDEAMTRAEEHLDVGVRSEEAGRIRLRKYVVTEQETVTVPVRKERATLEREPITDANRDDALAGPAISEGEHEVVLHEERPAVGTTAEPVERVRLGTESTTEEETVTGDVRKEQIEVEGDADQRPEK